MLSGSWRRSGPASLGRGSVSSFGGGGGIGGGGGVLLEAQYDYSYRGADGRHVSIQEGERFLLLKKTNVDWWQARRIGPGIKSKPLYVPATYVVELPIAMLHSPQPQTGSLQHKASANKLEGRVSLGSFSPAQQTQNSGEFSACADVMLFYFLFIINMLFLVVAFVNYKKMVQTLQMFVN